MGIVKLEDIEGCQIDEEIVCFGCLAADELDELTEEALITLSAHRKMRRRLVFL